MGAESEDSEAGPEEEVEAGPDDDRTGAEEVGDRSEKEVEVGPDDEKAGVEGTGARSEGERTEAGAPLERSFGHLELPPHIIPSDRRISRLR